MTASSSRKAWFHILHKPLPTNNWARVVNYFLAVVILANCTAVALETVESIYATREAVFAYLETISTGIFVVEYCLRLWVCVEPPRFSRPFIGRVKYAFHPLPLLDLIVIATYFAPVNLRFLRIFRLTRLLRVLHLEEFDESMQAVWRGIEKQKYMLVVSLTLMLIAVYFAAAMIYMVEHAAQPEAFSSIPETLWWAVVTLTTIGYGDVTPITALGKFLSGGIVIIGVGIFALPTAIVTAAILDAGLNHSTRCPHCGKMR